MSNVPPYDPYGQPPGGGYTPPPPPPPPGGGYNPPPPPPPGGYGAPPTQGGYGTPMPPPTGPYTGPSYGGAPGALAEWPMRALGILIDVVPVVVLGIILSFLGSIGTVLDIVVNLGWQIYLAVQLGETGSTPGMRVIGLKCVSKKTGQTIGAGMGVVRWLAHIIDGLACVIIGWVILPLATKDKQTIADMVMGTVVINVPKQPLSLTPPK